VGSATVGSATRDLSVDASDAPLTAPLTRDLGWAQVQAMSQSAAHRDNPVLHGIRSSAVVRRGTRMMKVLSAAQFTGHLSGWQPSGFCYRVHDVAHLRSPDRLALLRTDGTGNADADVAYALRWRAVDPADYEVPMGGVQAGLVALPAHSRVGPMVLGTGFTPSADDLIPEFVTADLADLPLSANAQLVAYTPGGDEVVLFSYQPEQHGWLRLVGPRWRHLLTGLPGVSPDRDYVPCADGRSSQLVGRSGNHEYEAVADPPHEFRVRALTRTARYPVTTLSRRAERATWRGAMCWVLQRDASWARLRLCRPDPDTVSVMGARCHERGVYEAWAPVGELVEHQVIDLPYVL
jgi:hypothetical protein